MTATIPAAPTPRVSTGGAWLGFFVAAWSALSVAASVLLPAAVALLPLLFDKLAREAEAQSGAGWADLPPEAVRLFDLLFELPPMFGAFSRIDGGTGIVLGLALFVAASALVVGSETGRRAVRVLLVVRALHMVAASAWTIALVVTRFAQWSERLRRAIDDLSTAVPHGPGFAPVSLQLSAGTQAALQALACVVGLGILATLYWLAGRPFAREWCAARSLRYPIASSGGPR